jgi:RNA polymerase sigma-70 factor (ECF subfamily)
MEQRDTALAVHRALADLPDDQRAALVLVDLQGHSVADTAQILGVAEGTIKSRCARGRARMAVMLGHLRPGFAPKGGPGDVRHPSARNQAAAGSVTSRAVATESLPSALDGRDQR